MNSITIPTKLLVIDDQISNWQSLVSSVSAGTAVLVLNAHSDGLNQINDYLTQLNASAASIAPLQSIHILSHGSSGRLLLGNSAITLENLSQYRQQLSALGSALDNTGDVLLYGCNVGEGERGVHFINLWAQLTGADIAASTNLTGSSAVGGDGVLEIATGTIEAPLWITSQYAGALAALEGTSADDTVTGTDASDTLLGLAGADVLNGGIGDDSLRGGAGNDTIDGGAGINTVIVEGNADAFSRRWTYDSATATVYLQLSDLVTGGTDGLNAADEGVDRITNVQKIQFVLPDGSIDSEVVVDDFANSANDSNQTINFGSWITGRFNYYSDTDWLRVSETAGQKYVMFAGSGNNFYYDNRYAYNSNLLSYTPSTTQIRDIQVSPYPYYLSSSSPNSSYGYSFVLRRQLDGTAANDSLDAGSAYEYLVGGAGNDTLMGSSRSDYLDGGDGNDVLTGGAGNDDLKGGAGNANVAVFSGKQADYSFQWLGSQDLGLRVGHLNNGVDGNDTLSNIQILRFADGEVVLDTQGSDPSGLTPNNIGQAMVGSLPGTTSGSYVDSDAFAQKFSGLSSTSNVRIKVVTSGDASSGYIDFSFKLIGTSDTLVFTDANTSSTISSFQQYSWNGTSQTWFVKPQYWGAGQQAFAGDRADIVVSGYAQGAFGSFLNYAITVDQVQLGTANDDTLSGDGKSTYIDGQAGNDVITGSVLAEEIQGGTGDDTLNGAGGNDSLVGGAGSNSLQGGEGDDTLNSRQATANNNGVTDTVDGGAGTDTLEISASQNISNMTISNVEILQADGGVSALTPAQVLAKGFTTANAITFRLDPSLANGGTLDASTLSGSLSLRGTNQSDVLTGNDQANTIYLASDTTTGNGLGIDTVSAGAGDDTIQLASYDWENWQQVFSAANNNTKTYQLAGNFDGGDGNDTLLINLYGYWYHPWGGNNYDTITPWHLDLSPLTLSHIEHLTFGGYRPNSVTLNVAQLTELSSLAGVSSLNIVGGGTIDLTKLASLGITEWHIGDTADYTLLGTVNSDTVSLEGNGNINASLAAGNDTLTLNGKSAVTDTLDGGEGNDTLVIRGTDVDLSGATLSSIETIQVASQSVSLTAEQWQTSTVSRVPGTSTAYILSIPTTGSTSLASDSIYSGLTGSAGDDHLIGNAADNILVGGAGNDELSGNAGADRLVSGAGIDTLTGGDGADTLVVTDKTSVRDQLDGGAGVDSLQLSDGQDITSATLIDIEGLTGSGTVTLTPEQLSQVQSVKGLTVQLNGTATSVALGSTQLSDHARVLLPQADTTVTTYEGVLGSKGDDTIIGSTGADILYGARGSDYLEGGAGADTLMGGSGTDVLVGNAGNDVFRVEASELANSSTTVYSDRIDGGADSDTLEVNFGASYVTYQINAGAMTNVERLVVNASYKSTVSLNADNWTALTSYTALSDQTYPYYWAKLRIEGKASTLNFDAVDASSKIGTVELTGTYQTIDASHLTLGKTTALSYNDALNYHYLSVNSFDSILLSSGNDLLKINGDTAFSVDAGVGDDTIKANVYGQLAATINGGEGNDTLDVSGYGFLDLTQSTLSSVEAINYGTSTLVLTDSQLASLSFDGTGAKFTKTGNTIVGTTANDSYTGNGSGLFQGGRGDDYISSVNTAIFTGNYADYDFTRSGTTLSIEQARGALTDGKDSLTNVLNAQFADTTLALDDALNSTNNYVLAELTQADYGKRISARHDYASDTDIFSASLVPNSPLAIAASSDKGSSWYIDFIDVATGQTLQFKSLVYGYNYGAYYNWMSTDQKWLPGFNTADGFQAYQGGEVVLQYHLSSSDIQNYAFTLNYLDDYAGSIDTLGSMNAQTGVIRGYIGEVADADWIRTSLIAGTKYEFQLKGVSSSGGTLVDPKLTLIDSSGHVVEAGLDIQTGAGNDDVLVFRPSSSGDYYLAVTDVANLNTGSWTLTQQSLDTIAGNLSTTERIDWNGGTRFSFSSEINTLSDHDWFKVWLDKGLTYNFKSAAQSLADPQLSLRSVTGILLAQDDNSGGGSDASLVYSAPDSGWYFLDAGASGNASKGTYLLTGSTLADDYANTVFTTGIVQAGTPASGLLSYTGDSDWFKAGLSQGKTYVIELVGDTSDTAQLDPITDPLLLIRDATGKLLLTADDFAGSLNARAYFTAPADGLYYLEAKSAFKYDIGAYQLSINQAPADDFVNTATSAAASLTLGTAQAGVIGIPADKDVFQVNLDAGKMYQFTVAGLASHAGTLIDPYLRVFDSQSQLLDFDNNSGVGNDAQVYFSPTSSGIYYLEASANTDRGMGSYQATVSQRDLPPDDVANDLSSTLNLNPGDSFNGSLLTHNDQDWFGITLAANKDYVFRVSASESGKGSLIDPVLEIHAADGSLLRTIDNMLISHEPAVLFTPTTAGKYYLVVKAADGATDTGTYTLSTRAPDDYSNTKIAADTVVINQTIEGGIQWSDGAFGVRAYDSIGLATDADEDWFQFSATKDQVLSVNVKMTATSTLSRPMVEIVNSQGLSLAVGDGLETNDGLAVASFKVPTSGAYFARVVDGAGATGTYQFTLTEGDASDEDSAGAVNLEFMNTGAILQAQTTARMGLPGDSDRFTVALQQDHNYRFETLAVRDGTHAPLASASLSLNYLVQGSSTTTPVEISKATATPSFFDSTVFTASTSGVMQIQVAPLDSTQTGEYKLRVIDLGINQEDTQANTVASYDEAAQGVLAANENASGKIDQADDVDLFAINLSTNNIYDFSVKSFADGLGSLAQAKLSLLNASGQLVSIGSVDNEAGRTNLAVSVFENGRYYLAVAATDVANNTGTYTLDTRLRATNTVLTDDISANTRSGSRVSPGQAMVGNIDFSDDHDWVKATLDANKVYVLDVLANGNGAGGTLKDAIVRIIDANGNEVAFDDNSGAGLDPHLQITPTHSGDFYVDVASNNAETGSYTVRLRELYSGTADPLKTAQWYLPALGLDALQNQVSGAGITIGMIDDGIDTIHPDLTTQIDFANSYDTATDTQNGAHKSIYDFHGTPVAGIIIGEQNNETGIVGVAPDASLASIRVQWTWNQITEALGLQDKFDVSNNSWGAILPFSDNFNSTALTFAYQGLRQGVEDGREGKGTVFVFSAGNSKAYGDNTNYHNFQNAKEVMTVGAVNQDGSVASFSTPGANVLVSSYGVNILTTDRHEPGLGLDKASNYTSGFSGTSAAAPMVSGVVALMLEANPNLGYRDVQKILTYSASHPDNQDWKTNAASTYNLNGLKFNDDAGFGVVDAYAAVRLAGGWTETNNTINEVSDSARAFGLQWAIPDDSSALTKTFQIDNAMRIEHVELGVDLRHSRLGDVVIELTSPSGTVSTLMNRPTVNAEQPFGLSGSDSSVPSHLLWDFSSVQFYGEDAVGTWTVSVKDVRAEATGTLNSLSLRVYGERDDGNDTYIFTEEGFKNQALRVLSDDAGIDTINAAVMTHDLYIDLSEGIIAAESVSYALSDWTVIEHVITGTANDNVVGNDANNNIKTFEGDDTLTGGAGNDSLIGGAGRDKAVYAGNISEFTQAWNPDTKILTLTDTKITGGDEGTDSLQGIERIVFKDGEISLSSTVGNHAPIANASVFATPVLISQGAGINYDLPSNVFSDSDSSTANELAITVTSAAGGELPEWLSYDPNTQKFTGVPPADYRAQLKLLVTATDAFNATDSNILTLQFGDNQAPVLATPSEKIIAEDAGNVALGLTAPTDPENKTVTVKILDIPSKGSVVDKTGALVTIGSDYTPDELTELHYQTIQDVNGDAGYLRYQAKDADNVVAESSIHLFIDPVNDAPRFATSQNKLTINYPTQSTVALDMLSPTDAESSLTEVKITELPAIGSVKLNGQALQLGQSLSLTQLQQLSFTLTENINGPIGGISIEATDPQGLSTQWQLALEVQGDAYSNIGSQLADAMYGSIGNDTLYGMAGNDTLVGNAGDDRLLGGIGDDNLLGSSGHDALDGSSGNDYLDGGLGSDILSGGPGNDVFVVDNIADVVLEVIAGGAGGKDLIVTSVSQGLPDNVENLQAQEGLTLDLTGNALNNILLGNALNNNLNGGVGRDTLLGGAGNDTLNGGVDVDRLAGGAGDDLFYVNSRFDITIELANEGNDTVTASSSFTLPSNIEGLILEEGGDFTGGGNSLNNSILGNGGNNILAGGLGADTLIGGLGNDIYVLSDSLDTIIDAGGTDTIRSTLDITLPNAIENAELVGIADAVATGNSASNTLIGNLGDNILEGLTGVDTLTGGEGSDQFVLSYNGAGIAVDQLTDFTTTVDLVVVDLASFGIDPSASMLSSSGIVDSHSFVKGPGVKAIDNNDYFLFDTAQGVLMFDIDGNGDSPALTIVKLVGASDTALSFSDIYVAI
jgi:Ca2+-binding RTX toxin-like protein